MALFPRPGNTLFGTLAGTPLTLVFLPVCPPLLFHDKVVSAHSLQSPRRMTAGASVPGHCRSEAGLPQIAPNGGLPALLGRRGGALTCGPAGLDDNKHLDVDPGDLARQCDESVASG